MTLATLFHLTFKFAGLFFLWWLLSGKTDALHFFLGAFSALAVVLAGFRRYEGSIKTLLGLPLLLIRGLLYALWLLGRIFQAAWHVAYLVLHPRMPLDPGFIEHESILTTDAEKVIFGNSITLTPGTITADIKGRNFTIHRLDKESADDVRSHEIEENIRKVFTQR